MKTKRTHDKAIMDLATETGVTDEEVRMIKRCRLFLRAETLLDICSADGKSIKEEAIQCSSKARLNSDEDWPRQPKHGKKHLRTWKALLATLCHHDETRLKHKLGAWTCEPSDQNWEAYYDPELNVALTKNLQGRWESRTVLKETRRGWKLSDGTTLNNLDKNNCIPTDISTRASGTTYISTTAEVEGQSQPRTRLPTTWEKHLRSIPTWESNLIRLSNEAENWTGLSAVLIDQSTSITVVSNSGYADEFGSFGWVISTEEEILWEGTGIARGTPMTAFRAEANGHLT